MFARLPRPVAALLAVLILLLCAWCLTTRPPPIKLAPKGGYTDVMLYKDITKAVAAGKPYHQAAAELHRAHFYPLKPFFTMRLPTLTMMAAKLGWGGVQNIAYVLVGIGVFLWVLALPEPFGVLERVAAGFAIAAGGSMVTNAGLLALHEYWAGMLMGLALALQIGWRRHWWLALIPAAAALAIRELALPFILLSLVFAAWERRWREVAAWAALVAAFALLMGWHAQHVVPLVRPTDLHSQGWNAMQGLSGFLKAVVFTSVLQPLPLGLALLGALLPMVGWGALGGRAGAFALAMFTGYAAMIAMFSRADTFYWGGIMLPAYFVGFALLPRAVAQLSTAIARPARRR